MTSHEPAGISRAIVGMGLLALMAMAGGCHQGETRPASDPYFLSDGMWCGVYAGSFPEIRTAVLTTTAMMKMEVLREAPMRHGGYVDCRTLQGEEIRIHFQTWSGRGEGRSTRVGIRVTGFGTHQTLCANILNQIGTQLAAPPVVVPTGPATAAAAPASAGPPITSPAQPGSSVGLPPQPVPVER